jgi:membrane-bound lytic murein transglycosylase B
MTDHEPREHGFRARWSREWLAALPLLALVVGVTWIIVASGTAQVTTAAVDPQARAGSIAAEVAPPAPELEPAVAAPSEPLTDRSALFGIAGAADPAWLDATAQFTGIPRRVLAAYAGAALALADEQPGCHLGWTTLAGIGNTESRHATLGGTTALPDGTTSQQILGPRLDGSAFESITDTDHGRWDGDEVWDRAVGPMQFIPGTWERWGADGNDDGVADPNQIDDASLATARYLCHSGDLSTGAGWQAAIYSYNHSDSYVATVTTTANAYARAARD